MSKNALKSTSMVNSFKLNQNGLTLIELLISITVGLLVVLAATGLVVSTKKLFLSQTEGNETQDTARFALDNISRSVRQSGYLNYDFVNSAKITPSTASADIVGMDANSVSATSDDIASPTGNSVNFSDLLAIRFFGSGKTGTGDGSVSNCAGFSVPEPVSSNTADQDRGWSIYYVTNDANGEPELFCKYYSSDSGKWSAQSLVKGVESFQVLYGVDTSNPKDGTANKFLTATAVNALDAALVLDGNTADEKAKDLNRKTFWKKITEIKVALLVSGAQNSRQDEAKTTYDLFGASYASTSSGVDKGTTIREADIPESRRNRIRKVYNATIQVRNVCDVDPDRDTCRSPN
jgi:type IV pilus assembly protein PilW